MWCVHKFFSTNTMLVMSNFRRHAPDEYDVIQNLHLHEISKHG